MREENSMNSLIGYAHAQIHLAIRRLEGVLSERGQGTVEYVGLILLVSLLMVGMVAAMKGFNSNWPLRGQPGDSA